MGFVEKIFDQTFSRHPYLFLFMVMITGSVLAHSYDVFAQKTFVIDRIEQREQFVLEVFDEYKKQSKEKLSGIENKISEMERTVLDMFSRQAIINYNSEIHSLTELDRSGKANDRDRKRLRDLKIALDREIDSSNLREHGTSGI